MRIVIAGQRSFGTAIYDRLKGEHEVVGVVCPPDDTLWFRIPADIEWHPGTAEDQPYSMPLHLWMENRCADVVVGAHSHAYLGRKTRAATRLGAIGYHPSLLPRHRGRDAVRWTVAMRDPIAGGSVYWFTDNVDGGPVAAQRWCHVDPAWDAHDLWREKLFPIGVELLAETLADLDRGIIVAEPQDQRFATWEPSWERAPLHRPELPELGAPGGFEVRGRVDR